jgi:WD40 repeat protein
MSQGLCSACLFEVMLEPVEHEEQAPRAAEGLATLSGRYRLREIIGEGGFGTVHVAEQLEPVRRQVAVKILKPGMDSRRVIARFEAERQALALMEHPHIAHVFDAGTTETSRPFFVMELVRGVPITEYCRRHALDPWTRLDLFMQVCSAVQHAHQKGIIHRDLKPTNILVSPSDSSAAAGVPKVIDFGIAKATGEFRLTEETLQTQFHQFLGTPAYMSPEQADLKGMDIDTRSDIYSLGVLLYELLAGVTPFETEELLRSGLNEMCRVIREQEPPLPSTRLTTATSGPAAWKAEQRREFISAVRGDLDWVVMKCLEKDRTRRYASASDLAADIRRHLQHEPVAARPPSAAYRIQKYVRRHRLFVVAGAAVVVSLLGGLLTSLALLVREQHARTRAVAAEMAQDRLRRTAEEARADVDRANRQLASNLRQREWRRAEELAAGGKRADALALFAHLFREQPDDTLAATRLLSAFSHRSFALPVGTPFAHQGIVTVVRFSPQGDRLLTAADDGRACLWNVKTGALLMTMTNGPSLNGVFNSAGDRVLLTSTDGTTRLWDCHEGVRLAAIPGHSPHPSPRDARVALITPSASVTIVDSRTGNVEATVPLPSQARVLDWTPDARGLVIGGVDGRVRLWSFAEKRAQWESPPWRGEIRAIRVSPDGSHLVVGTTSGAIGFLDLSSGALAHQVKDRGIEILHVTISPDSRSVATYAYGEHPVIWDLQSGAELFRLPGDPGIVASMRFGSTSRQFALGTHMGLVQVWDLEAHQLALEPFEHIGPISTIDFSPDGALLAAASQDGSAQLWDTRMSDPPARSWPAGPVGSDVRTVRFARDGRCVAVVSGSAAGLFDAATGEPLTPPLRHSNSVRHVTFSPDEGLLATGSDDSTARLWDAATGRPVGKPMQHSAVVWEASFSPDGHCLATASRDGQLRVFDVSNQQLLAQQRLPGEIYVARYHPDGACILTICTDGGIRLHSSTNLELLVPPLRHQGTVWGAEFSPCGTRLLSGSADRTARIWDVRTGQAITPPMRHAKGVQIARFSPDGRHVVTAAEDGAARVWDATTGEPVSPAFRRPSPNLLNGATFSPDGRWVITSDQAGAYVWDALSGASVSEALVQPSGLRHARFYPDGQRILSFSRDGIGRSWDFQVSPSPAPLWLADLAEGLACRKVDAQGDFVAVAPGALEPLRRRLLAGSGDDYYSRWARWFFVERLAR